MSDETAHQGQPLDNLTLAAYFLDSDSSLKLRELEKAAVEAAFQRTGGNIMQACKLLGIGRTTLYRKLRNYGIRDAA